VSRRLLAWIVSVPLVAAGVECGHWLAYRVVYPDPYSRGQTLAASGHHYLSDAPLFFAVLGAVALCAFGLRVFRRGAPGSGAVRVSLLPFLLVSPLAFALQECTERLFVGGWPFAAVLAPTFMPGLLFQVPFALLAFAAARWLLRAADRLRALVLGGRPARVSARPVLCLPRFELLVLPRVAPLAGGRSERGPPGWICRCLPLPVAGRS